MKPISFKHLPLFSAILLISSCILPYYYPSAPPKRIMQISDFKPDVTTKEEVFLKFGASFYIDPEENVFTYSYHTDSGTGGLFWSFLNMGGTAGTTRLVSQHDIRIYFDDNDVVIKCIETAGDFPKPSRIKTATGVDVLDALSHPKW